MTAPSGDPAYKLATWKTGYQGRQYGVAGPSVYTALAAPPAAMVTAAEKGLKKPVADTTGTLIPGTDGPEDLPY